MALSDYIQLEYIESTGNQFIALNYIPKTLHTKYELGFMRTGISGTWNPIINSEEDVRFGIMCTTDGGNRDNYGQFHIGPANSGFKSIQFPISSNIKYDIIADKTGISLNGIKYSVSGVSDATGQWSTYINHRLRTSTTFSPEYSIGRWYYLKVYEDNNLIKNYIPAKRKSDNVLGMYEKLEDKFYTNAGTGTFTAGPEKDNISNYQKLEYIESTGTQYIDTLVNPVTNKTYIEIKITSTLPAGGGVFGVSVSNGNTYFGSIHRGTHNFEFYMYNWDYQSYMVLDNSNTHPNQIIKYNSSGRYITDFNGNVYAQKTNNIGTFSIAQNMTIFKWNNNDIWSGKIYYCKLWNDQNLIRDLIPVKRISDGELGMYDKVDNAFYPNAGTGTFVAGPTIYDGSQLQQNLLEIKDELSLELNNMYNAFPELHEPYIELEYIESTGTQYIDTLQKGNSNTKIELKFYNSYTSSSEKAVFGSRTFPRSNCLMIGFFSNGWVCYNNEEGAFANILNKVTELKLVKNNMYVLNSSTQQYELVKTYNSGSFTTPSNMILFGERRDNDVTQLSSIKVYYCKIYDGDVLVRDLIPVRRLSDKVICMYDKVTKQYFTNQGTGNFIAGPEVN